MLLAQGTSEGVMRFRLLRRQPHRDPQFDYGFVEIPFREERLRQIVMRNRQIGLEIGHDPEVVDGPVGLSRCNITCARAFCASALRGFSFTARSNASRAVARSPFFIAASPCAYVDPGSGRAGLCARAGIAGLSISTRTSHADSKARRFLPGNANTVLTRVRAVRQFLQQRA